jgi:hypothetical protein
MNGVRYRDENSQSAHLMLRADKLPQRHIGSKRLTDALIGQMKK